MKFKTCYNKLIAKHLNIFLSFFLILCLKCTFLSLSNISRLHIKQYQAYFNRFNPLLVVSQCSNIKNKTALADAPEWIMDSSCLKRSRGLECLLQVRSGAFCSFVSSLQRRCGMQTSWEQRRRKRRREREARGRCTGGRLEEGKNGCKESSDSVCGLLGQKKC